MSDETDIGGYERDDVTLDEGNADELALEYFSTSSYEMLFTGKKDKAGKEITIQIPTEPRTWEGLVSKYEVPLARIMGWMSKDMVEVCHAKYKHAMMANGLTGVYEASPWSLMMKNEHGYSEKAESKVVREVVLSDADRRLLARAGVLTLEGEVDSPQGVDVSCT